MKKLILSLTLLFLFYNIVSAEEDIPIYHIDAAIEKDMSLLRAEAIIKLPKGKKVMVSIKGLNVDSVTYNNNTIETERDYISIKKRKKEGILKIIYTITLKDRGVNKEGF
ncbi:MAG: hypothetical protein D6828_05130, partial [Nitrospirae bacterium]